MAEALDFTRFLGNEGKDKEEIKEYLMQELGLPEARELLANPKNNFTIRIGNRLYPHKGRLDTWLLSQIL